MKLSIMLLHFCLMNIPLMSMNNNDQPASFWPKLLMKSSILATGATALYLYCFSQPNAGISAVHDFKLVAWTRYGIGETPFNIHYSRLHPALVDPLTDISHSLCPEARVTATEKPVCMYWIPNQQGYDYSPVKTNEFMNTLEQECHKYFPKDNQTLQETLNYNHKKKAARKILSKALESTNQRILVKPSYDTLMESVKKNCAEEERMEAAQKRYYARLKKLKEQQKQQK